MLTNVVKSPFQTLSWLTNRLLFFILYIRASESAPPPLYIPILIREKKADSLLFPAWLKMIWLIETADKLC